ncbi:MAG: Gfo/Idh/MocA family oxidoreductase [Bacteroidales bacterium]|nr:Gfo/Idh/MocA family oxidoreductase [Bacteroidales bacterium]MCF8390731.1 Gfo/Idh/MocA family oxidoreductase [Bacteroidales bacterium]
MKSNYSWGILGPGKIAHKFAQGLSVTKKGKLSGVASRSEERAKQFAEKYGAAKFYGSYEDLIEDEEIDIIYISTPHHLHYELSKKCILKGKNVLCEKPAAINSVQFEELRMLAKEKSVFYMDALWTRFLPGIIKALELLPQIGDVKSINCDFGFKADYDPDSRLFNPEYGGGSILDIGIYTLFIPLLFLGYPDKISAEGKLGTTGVDESATMILNYSSGAEANLFSTFLANTTTMAEITGSKGSLRLNPRFFTPTSLNVSLTGKEDKLFEFETKMNGYEYEAEEVMNCLDKGMTESKLLPLSFTSDLMKLMDEVRRQIGVKYSWD